MADVRSPFATPDTGIAQVMVADTDRACGMAFLVSPTLAVTCAHVVNVALGRSTLDRSTLPDGGKVTLLFPFAPVTRGEDGYEVDERKAKVPHFNPPGRLPSDDIALLELDEPAPVEVGLTVLAEVRNVSLDLDRLGVLGPAEELELLVHYDARFGGATNSAWTQIDAVQPTDGFVRGGFSGGRVWSHTQEAAIGMIAAVQVGTAEKRAFMISAAAIRGVLPKLPSEVRRVGPYFCSIWTVFAGFFFLMMLTHFLGERTGGYPVTLALGGGNKIVTGFFGMNIVAVLMPLLLAMLLRFAPGYREHPWWMRLPRFGHFTRPAQPTASRTAAVLTLALFVVIPLYVQGHFLRIFHTRGDIYIYPGQFGYTADELERAGQRCYRPSVHYCTHKDARAFSLATPKSNSSGGYIDNTYHYGKRDLEPPNSVTFFPIVQPLLIWLSYLGCIAAAGVLALKVFSAPTSHHSRRRAG